MSTKIKAKKLIEAAVNKKFKDGSLKWEKGDILWSWDGINDINITVKGTTDQDEAEEAALEIPGISPDFSVTDTNIDENENSITLSCTRSEDRDDAEEEYESENEQD